MIVAAYSSKQESNYVHFLFHIVTVAYFFLNKFFI